MLGSFTISVGMQLFPSRNDGDVSGSDCRDGTDLAPDGGSDVPNIYFHNGHGSCENPPTATSGDFVIVCGNCGKPDVTNIGNSSRWGNGNLKFAFIDASCPMDLVELSNSWFARGPRTIDRRFALTGWSGSVYNRCVGAGVSRVRFLHALPRGERRVGWVGFRSSTTSRPTSSSTSFWRVEN
jgi:hypothetical protein